MIVRPRPGLRQLFFVLQGSVLPRVIPQILIVGLISAAVVAAHQVWPRALPTYSGAPFALLGIAISIFLNFRNNACYDRWWEARKQWGELVHLSRNLSRQTLILEEADRTRFLRLNCALGHALVQYLRPGFGEQEKVTQFLEGDDIALWQASLFPPDAILRRMSQHLAALKARGQVSDISYQMFDQTLSGMSGVQTACERIRTTPVPFGYTLLLHRTAYLFCFLMPFGFADMLGWATPLSSMLVAYTFFGLDSLGDELEDPFGTSANHLPLSAMATIIELNLREAMGETNLPALPEPVNNVLI
jgi:ion channel-forming bestrophin family protein